MTFDPTTNLVVFGLLEPDEQKTLKAWPHGWEVFQGNNFWKNVEDPSWFENGVYRAKAAPIAGTYYINVYMSGGTGSSFLDKELAVKEAVGKNRLGVIQLKITDGKLVSVNITD